MQTGICRVIYVSVHVCLHTLPLLAGVWSLFKAATCLKQPTSSGPRVDCETCIM